MVGEHSFDVVVIGSGPGGYIAAIRASQLKLSVALVEKYPTLGGTCLNVGCIPSKALLDSSEQYYNAVHRFAKHGIKIPPPELDFSQMVARKAQVVEENSRGVELLMKKNKVAVFHGIGRFASPTTVEVVNKEEIIALKARHIIIATGSKPATLPGITVDKKRIITSTEALSLPEVPRELVVIGGGVIGMELGTVFARLGARVKVVEYLDRIIGTFDRALGKELLKISSQLGMEFFLQHAVQSVEYVNIDRIQVKAVNSEGSPVFIEGDYCLVAVGRRPYTEGLNLEAAGLTTDAKGFIPVDENCRTSVPHIWAIGDVVRGPMLAHKAEEEGAAVAERIAGGKPLIHYHLIPNVVYTWPEVASVGYSEEQLKESQRPYRVGQFPFLASGRARASMDTEGFVKVLADPLSDEILGVHIIGPRAADLIAEATLAMEFKAAAEDIGRICHAHPTFSEALKEASLAASGLGALNM
ncbi:MAG: dihydrolipoyl dehydrogenase [Flavobacteriales bacterium]|nr:dihydrolipoyl dehydrogenase [Flavobacteriales bacterium]